MPTRKAATPLLCVAALQNLAEARAGPGLRGSVLECGDGSRLAGVITALAGGAGCVSATRSSCGISMPTRKAATPLLCVAALQNLAEACAGLGLRGSVLECGDGSRLAGVITALAGGAECVSAIRSRSGDIDAHKESGDFASRWLLYRIDGTR